MIAHAAPKLALDAALYNARAMGLPAILTPRDMCDAWARFKGKCAYCQRARARLVEHFVPLRHGGGTMASNCLPACRSCNTSKSGRADPVAWVRERFGRVRCAEVRRYLRLRAPRDARTMAKVAQRDAAAAVVVAAVAWARRPNPGTGDALRVAVRRFRKIRNVTP